MDCNFLGNARGRRVRGLRLELWLVLVGVRVSVKT